MQIVVGAGWAGCAAALAAGKQGAGVTLVERTDMLLGAGLVEGVGNLFCAGEKAGLLVGHTEAIVRARRGSPRRPPA